jgi:thiopurine S-methyltransferase
MDPAFWIARWESGQTGWHRDTVHDGLKGHFARLGSPKRVLVPLCGASLDVQWLARQSSVEAVIGIDLSPVAAARLFEEAGLIPEREVQGDHTWWRAENISLCVGDFFSAHPGDFCNIDAVWDRAAMIAIDPSTRSAYADKLRALAPGAQLLLNALVYDASLHDGPPWSLSSEQVRAFFSSVETLATTDSLDERWRERGHTWMHTELHLIGL